MTKGVWIKTFGCQMNSYDSTKIMSSLAEHGFEKANNYDDSDCSVVILNTCHIREKADDKLFSDIGRISAAKAKALRRNKPYVIIVAGCIAQARGHGVVQRARCVDGVVGPQSIHKLLEIIQNIQVKQISRQQYRPIIAVDMNHEDKFGFLAHTNFECGGVSAFVTVQEGCDNCCTYCVVPFTRGREYSRNVEDIKHEVELLVNSGIKEIILGGQNVNAFNGKKSTGEVLDLVDLIEELALNSAIKRIRFLTSHPRNISKRLINAFGRIDVLMPFIHLPVQSGSNRILRMMNRHHERELYFDIVNQLRDICPPIGISSDFIVGFPGESEQDFEQTLELVERVKFAQAYSFKFSSRPNTPAENMPDHVSEEVKEHRLAILQKLLDKQQSDFNENTVNSVQSVLFERLGRYEGQLIGKTPFNQSTYVDAPIDYIGNIKQVHIKELDKHSLYGVLI